MIHSTTFDGFALVEGLRDGISKKGFESPTPIQQAVIPRVIAGQSLLGLSATGEGKTDAYVLPILQRLAESQDSGIAVLVIAPTRELAIQISSEFNELGRPIGVISSAIFGGIPYRESLQELIKNPAVVIGTPGRLLDLALHRDIDLRAVRTLVLDEVDLVLDKGFEEEVAAILKLLPTSRQNLFFSATSNDQVEAFIKKRFGSAERVAVEHGCPIAKIRYVAYHVPQEEKLAQLLYLLETSLSGQGLIFTNRRCDADDLVTSLRHSRQSATALHKEIPQFARIRRTEAFRQGEVRILVASDIAARGMDFEGLAFVVNMETPLNAGLLIHRSGRTGRAGAEGLCVTLVAPSEARRFAEQIRVLGINAEELAPRPADGNGTLPVADQKPKATPVAVRPVVATPEDEKPLKEANDPWTLSPVIPTASKPEDLLERLTGYRFKNPDLLADALGRGTPARFGRTLDNAFGLDIVRIAVIDGLTPDLRNIHIRSLNEARMQAMSPNEIADAAKRAGIEDLVRLFPPRSGSIIPSQIFFNIAGAMFLDGSFGAAHKFISNAVNLMPALLKSIYRRTPPPLNPQLKIELEELTGHTFRDVHLVNDAFGPAQISGKPFWGSPCYVARGSAILILAAGDLMSRGTQVSVRQLLDKRFRRLESSDTFTSPAGRELLALFGQCRDGPAFTPQDSRALRNALIGAVYTDAGYEAAKAVFARIEEGFVQRDELARKTDPPAPPKEDRKPAPRAAAAAAGKDAGSVVLKQPVTAAKENAPVDHAV